MKIKQHQIINVLEATQIRISQTFDDFEKICVSFSGGKDSTVMLHLVMDEARKRNRKVAVLIIDLEAQYQDTIKHMEEMIEIYKDNMELYWVCVPMLLRNAVTQFQPQWITWDQTKKDIWVREMPAIATTEKDLPFYLPPMEFEEFIVLFPQWYSQGKMTASFIGIRADESLHRYLAVANQKKGLTWKKRKWTTKTNANTYNIYPIYDWKTEDIWTYHVRFPDKKYNQVYEKMYKAGVPLGDQRLCQPYGDDQKKGLWLYHILEPNTWYKLIARVNGVNSGALYIKEKGNMTGYDKISKPDHHTWKSFANLLLKSLPKPTRDHYIGRFKKFISGWKDRGYPIVPDEAPRELENNQWVPSYRRLCKVILRNDYWCKSLGQTQPKSPAYLKYKEFVKAKKEGKQADFSTPKSYFNTK